MTSLQNEEETSGPHTHICEFIEWQHMHVFTMSKETNDKLERNTYAQTIRLLLPLSFCHPTPSLSPTDTNKHASRKNWRKRK